MSYCGPDSRRHPGQEAIGPSPSRPRAHVGEGQETGETARGSEGTAGGDGEPKVPLGGQAPTGSKEVKPQTKRRSWG